jgi:hypothetical protein
MSAIGSTASSTPSAPYSSVIDTRIVGNVRRGDAARLRNALQAMSDDDVLAAVDAIKRYVAAGSPPLIGETNDRE